MHHKLSNYIRTHRLRWGLTQEELAHLFGAKSGAQVSQRERFQRKPTLEIVLACQVIFGEPLESMFPKLFSEVEEGVMQRVYELYQTLEGSTSKAGKKKLKLLDDVLSRAKARANHDEA